MRVYLPSTLSAVAGLLTTGQVGPAPVRGYTVTPALREWYSSGDIEELEYVAMMHAARESLRLLAADPTAPTRRVVLAVEVAEDRIVPNGGFDDPAQVDLSAPVPLRDVMSGHVDDASAATQIATAVAALPAADTGDDDARFLVDGAEGYEMQWYATQELGDLTGSAG